MGPTRIRICSCRSPNLCPPRLQDPFRSLSPRFPCKEQTIQYVNNLFNINTILRNWRGPDFLATMRGLACIVIVIHIVYTGRTKYKISEQTQGRDKLIPHPAKDCVGFIAGEPTNNVNTRLWCSLVKMGIDKRQDVLLVFILKKFALRLQLTLQSFVPLNGELFKAVKDDNPQQNHAIIEQQTPMMERK